MNFVSYAQNCEDVVLWRIFSDIKNGFYVDIGAGWPEKDSVTNAFYKRLWTGINVEPNPELFCQLSAARTRDINLDCAIGLGEDNANLFVVPGTGLSTLVSDVARRHEAAGWLSHLRSVKVCTLQSVLQEFLPKGKEVHFLKIDVEGFEKSVVLSNDWDIFRPWVVVIEATQPMSQVESFFEWEDVLLKARYQFVYADGLNRFYLADEHVALKSRFKYPPNVFDQFIPIALIEATDKIAILEQKQLECNESSERDSECIRKLRSDTASLETRLESTSIECKTLTSRLEALSQTLTLTRESLDFAEKRIPLLESSLLQAEERAQGAERLLIIMEQRASAAVSHAGASEERALIAESRADSAEARAQNSDQGAREAEAHALACERRASDAEARADSAEARARNSDLHTQIAELRVADLGQSLADARICVRELEHQLAAGREFTARMETQLALAERRCEEKDNALLKSHESLQILQSESARVTLELERIGTHARMWKMRAERFERSSERCHESLEAERQCMREVLAEKRELQSALHNAQQQIVTLHASNHFHWQRTQELEISYLSVASQREAYESQSHALLDELSAVRSSLSWRITAPLRVMAKPLLRVAKMCIRPRDLLPTLVGSSMKNAGLVRSVHSLVDWSPRIARFAKHLVARILNEDSSRHQAPPALLVDSLAQGLVSDTSPRIDILDLQVVGTELAHGISPNASANELAQTDLAVDDHYPKGLPLEPVVVQPKPPVMESRQSRRNRSRAEWAASVRQGGASKCA